MSNTVIPFVKKPEVEKFALTVCANCGINFAVPAIWIEQRRSDHQGFHCPNGHGLIFKVPTSMELLKQEIASLKAEITELKAVKKRKRSIFQSLVGAKS